MSNARMSVLSLYKTLLRESKKLNSYNFRLYALEKIRYEFSTNKTVADPAQIAILVKKGQDNLDVIKRQVLVGHMYGEGHLVIEHADQKSDSGT